ncbi:O-methyltransferase [Glutamicibacter sp. BW78]|uniref:O-methyltransferase n=1 Tax=Glutamicibacter sp. BW78 TaxID=2024403 RepID=UPI001F537B1D|nr:O-methyltransferase [Glutamicibacter sp. BW78]
MNEFGSPVPVNRYEATDDWHAVDRYFTSTLVREDSILAVARDSGDATTMPNAEVAANQGAFLEILAKIAGARRVLEFGTLAGYSTIWLARAVGEQGQVVTLELEPENAAVAKANFHAAGVSHQIETIVGPATESTERLINDDTEPFDFVFIDADKPNNPAYLAAALKLTHSGAVIVIDNVVRNGAVADAASADPRVQGVRTVAEDIAAHPDLDGTALQTVGEKGWDGLIIARRR